jgi:hypothetical protein
VYTALKSASAREVVNADAEALLGLQERNEELQVQLENGAAEATRLAATHRTELAKLRIDLEDELNTTQRLLKLAISDRTTAEIARLATQTQFESSMSQLTELQNMRVLREEIIIRLEKSVEDQGSTIASLEKEKGGISRYGRRAPFRARSLISYI